MIFLLFLQLVLGSLFSCQGQLPPPPSLVAVDGGGNHSATDTDADTDTDTRTDTNTDTGTDTETETGVDTSSSELVSVLLCPEEMSFVSPTTCIDRWEVGIDFDAEGGPASFSEAGITPHLGMTYSDFSRACENTPVKIGGKTLGYKRLPTHDEWTASGGEAVYSFGEDWENDICITPDLDPVTGASSGAWDEVQPTGSAAQCVSPFGVFDLTGNSWEWTASGIVADGAATIQTLAKAGVTLEVDEEGYLLVPDGRTTGMRLSMQATDSVIHVDDATTRLYLVVLEGDPPRAGGYIFPDAEGNRDFFPVTVDTDTDLGVHWLKYWGDIDGAPIPDKTGCAYYSGSLESCALGYSSLGSHTPEFSGSIGGRCAATPITTQVTPEEAESLVASHQAGWPE